MAICGRWIRVGVALAAITSAFWVWEGRSASAVERPPLVHLSFEGNLQDRGPHHLSGEAHGDEVSTRPGLHGQSLFVGGTKDWLDVPLGDQISLNHGFTAEVWLRRDDWLNPYRGGSGWQTVAAIGTGASLNITAPGCPLHEPWALVASVSRYRRDVRESDFARAISPPNLVPANRWIHAAMVYDPAASTLILYLNGTVVDQARGAPPPDLVPRRIRLGTWHKANQAFRGDLDEFVLYDYPRSAEAIALDARTRE